MKTAARRRRAFEFAAGHCGRLRLLQAAVWESELEEFHVQDRTTVCWDLGAGPRRAGFRSRRWPWSLPADNGAGVSSAEREDREILFSCPSLVGSEQCIVAVDTPSGTW